MKIHEYNEMMAYLTRPAVNRVGFAKRGYVKLTPAEKAAAYAARTPTQTLVKEKNIKKLLIVIQIIGRKKIFEEKVN